MKRNIERVEAWLREAGVTSVELREMKSRCCPFHWSSYNPAYIEVNPETSRRTLRKHFKKDILPAFTSKYARSPHHDAQPPRWATVDTGSLLG